MTQVWQPDAALRHHDNTSDRQHSKSIGSANTNINIFEDDKIYTKQRRCAIPYPNPCPPTLRINS
jgi:hypothetical protein